METELEKFINDFPNDKQIECRTLLRKLFEAGRLLGNNQLLFERDYDSRSPEDQRTNPATKAVKEHMRELDIQRIRLERILKGEPVEGIPPPGLLGLGD